MTKNASHDILGIPLMGHLALKGRVARHFAFCETGPVSPDPQPASFGRVTPGALRLRKHTANPNRGLKKSILRIQEKYFRKDGIVLCATPVFSNESRNVDSITEDYEKVFSLMYDFVGMFCIDTTLRDSEGARPMQDAEMLSDVLDALLAMRLCYDTAKPILVRVADDIDRDELDAIIGHCRLGGAEGIMVADGPASADTVRHIVEVTSGRYPVIGCCGRLEEQAVRALFEAGACMVQGTSRGNFKEK